MMKDFLEIQDFTGEQLVALLDRAIADKRRFLAGALPATLARKTLAMIFEKPSLRTRVSFEAAMAHLGGHALYLAPADIGLGTREPVQDVARVLAGMCDGIMARTFSHQVVRQLADHAAVPVINALTDWSHPCQAMADVLTIKEHFDDIKGIKIAFIGDGNNVARSLAHACAKLGMQMVVATPAGYELDAESLQRANGISADCVRQTNDPHDAVADADVIYTDTWISMGQENEKQKRQADFAAYQVNAELVKKAPENARIMHCLPAYRGLEITDDIVESPNSIIFDQAENRLHFQRALLKKLMSQPS